MRKPMISAEQYGWVEVVDAVSGMGVFVDVGLSKNVKIIAGSRPGKPLDIGSFTLFYYN